jgi:hypothetical protein
MFTLHPDDPDFLSKLEFLLEFFAGIGGQILFIIGLRRCLRSGVAAE